jgi:hypothetical protein
MHSVSMILLTLACRLLQSQTAATDQGLHGSRALMLPTVAFKLPHHNTNIIHAVMAASAVKADRLGTQVGFDY